MDNNLRKLPVILAPSGANYQEWHNDITGILRRKKLLNTTKTQVNESKADKVADNEQAIGYIQQSVHQSLETIVLDTGNSFVFECVDDRLFLHCFRGSW